MKWIISNHKAGIPICQLSTYIQELNHLSYPNIQLVVCPNDHQISYFKGTNYLLGCQNIDSNKMKILKNLPIHYCIVGHSDDREQYHETNSVINDKIKKLLQNDIYPILCIGERNKEEPDIKAILKQELVEGLKDIKSDAVIIAYEPVWAIQSGDIPNRKKLIDIIEWIQTICNEVLGTIPTILYGGSVNQETISILETIPMLNGYLVGSASLEIDQLKKIIEVVK